LKEEYRFRVLLDESNSFGVLGSSGRGLTEYYGVPVCFERLTNPLFFSKSKLTQLLFVIDGGLALQIEKIDIVTAAMGHALATEGGFCTGSARVIDHQVCKLYIKGMTFL
jgi:serine palmitoyltransferase